MANRWTRVQWQVISLVLLIVFAATVLAGCGQAQAPAKQEPAKPEPAKTEPPKAAEPAKKRLNIATATTGGAYYPAGIAAAQLFTEQAGVQASASTSAGSVENIDLLMKGEADIVCVQSNILQWAYEGSDTYKGKPNQDLRILAPILSQHYNFVIRKNAGIKSVRDWKGKRVVVGRAGSGTVSTHEMVLGAFGMTLQDVKPDYIGQAEAIEAIRNGLADATIAVGAAPISQVSDALVAPNTNAAVLSLSDEEIKTITEKHKWSMAMPIPAGTYPNQKDEIKTVGHLGYFVVRKDFPQDLAYKLVKAMYDNKDWLTKSYSGYNNVAFLEPAKALSIPVPLHEGSKKYLQEKGWVK
ncbi:MAG: TAXI family TRAP transporter solute-binding subunit [Firmicutes bacterium]|nr:TAXI family TRAP transporter solute-binding subunit [Bacillota bacterium]